MTDETENKTTVDTSKRLKESDWIVIVSLWERGETTLSELALKFGISAAALSQGLKRRGAVRGSKAHISEKKIQQKIEDEKEKLIEDIYNFKKRYIKYGDLIMNLTISEITECKKRSAPLRTVQPDLHALNTAAKNLKSIRHDLFHLYDMYDKETSIEEDFKFDIGVYTEQDIEALREAQKVLDDINSSDDEDDQEDEEYSDYGDR